MIFRSNFEYLVRDWAVRVNFNTVLTNGSLLIVGMADSVHLANWLENMKGLRLKVTLVSSSPHRRIHPKISQLLENNSKDQQMRLTMPFWSRHLSLFLWFLDIFLRNNIRGCLLKALIHKSEPNWIHAFEFQHAGYLLLRALGSRRSGVLPKIVISNYGSDIYWFGRFHWHRQKIRKVLALASVYTCECFRDVDLAGELGYRDKVTFVLPNTGGIEDCLLLTNNDVVKASLRKTILVKGYDNKFGRAREALYVIWKIRRKLNEFEIICFSSNFKIFLFANLLKRMTPLRISSYRKNSLGHDEMLSLFSKARIYVALSRSDGISTSLLESMAMGAFPLQTGTSCAEEWVTSGLTGEIITLGNKVELEEQILEALENDELVDSAQVINRDKILRSYSKTVMRDRVVKFYSVDLGLVLS